MPDPYVIPTVISTVGTLAGALGGVALGNWVSARQEQRRAGRERADQQEQARWTACADLLGAAAQLRVQVRTLGSRHWADMNVRLSAAEDQVTSVGLYASRVALLAPGPVSDAALALSVTAGELAARIAKDARLGTRTAEPFIGGELPAAPDLGDLDARIDAFRRAAAAVAGATVTGSAPAIPGPRVPGS
jgi:hypothetical protein